MKLCPHKLETFQRAFRGCVAIIENVILAKVFDIKWHQGLFWSIPCGLNVLLWYSGSILDHFWQILSEKNYHYTTTILTTILQHQISVINAISLKLAATINNTIIQNTFFLSEVAAGSVVKIQWRYWYHMKLEAQIKFVICDFGLYK